LSVFDIFGIFIFAFFLGSALVGLRSGRFRVDDSPPALVALPSIKSTVMFVSSSTFIFFGPYCR
jgi:hypothetical protein